MLRFLSVVTLVAVLGLVACDTRQSPCPDQFKYLEEKSGQWVGELTFQSEYVLHGVWARLIFDAPITTIKTKDFGEAVWHKDEPTEALIKDRKYLVKKNTPFKVKIVVTYEGDKAPALKGFRLNARTFCPVGEE